MWLKNWACHTHFKLKFEKGLTGLIFLPQPPNFQNKYNFWRSSNDITMTFWYSYWFPIFKKIQKPSCPSLKGSVAQCTHSTVNNSWFITKHQGKLCVRSMWQKQCLAFISKEKIWIIKKRPQETYFISSTSLDDKLITFFTSKWENSYFLLVFSHSCNLADL